jgi:hypothetical protein
MCITTIVMSTTWRLRHPRLKRLPRLVAALPLPLRQAALRNGFEGLKTRAAPTGAALIYFFC